MPFLLLSFASLILVSIYDLFFFVFSLLQTRKIRFSCLSSSLPHTPSLSLSSLLFTTYLALDWVASRMKRKTTQPQGTKIIITGWRRNGESHFFIWWRGVVTSNVLVFSLCHVVFLCDSFKMYQNECIQILISI